MCQSFCQKGFFTHPYVVNSTRIHVYTITILSNEQNLVFTYWDSIQLECIN